LAFAAFAAAVSVALTLPGRCSAEAPAPAKKDSPARAKPKDAVVTASVEPAEVRPGGTVVYKVTAKLSPGYHIYIYSKKDNEVGPKNTRFDFFDTAGLTIDGDWTPSKEATTKKEPAFPELESVSFYEDEVTWSLTLKVPADAAPGKKVLRCQASYQLCNAESCSFPGRWTLPDAAVTVLAGDKAQDRAVVPTSAPQAAKPSKKDTPARIQPKTAKLSTAFSPAEARPGETVKLQVTAKIEPGWHIYDYVKQQPEQGPKGTEFEVFDAAGLQVGGDWSSDTKPQTKPDPAFNNLVVSYFEDQVTWSLPFTVPADAPAGSRSVQVQAYYQVCNAMSCLGPGRWTLPAATLTVLPAGAAHATAAPATTGKAEAAPATAKAEPASAETPTAPAPPELKTQEGKGPRVVSEVEKTAQQGIIPLMIASALGGLLALVMPCVWPMVPITVNFFVKQGHKNGGSTTGLAITYCLAIIGVFTAVGVLCSFFLSATALPRLANNPWLNFAVAGLFFAFGLSLLGLFEIRLPNALLNASARGESRGGLLGVVFMALTLTITSFTCTFPVVGGLLVMASTGQFFYPIVGLATFATVLALPFFLLALSPGLLSKVPKSGDWMNAVKVVGGLIEIGAAFKFLNTAELAFVTPDQAWINAPFILTAWVVLAAVCGFYLLGFFRTDHDHEEVKIGPGRMIIGSSFLGMALFLALALFGRPPQSPIWSRLVVGLLPPDVSTLAATSAGPARAGEAAAEEVHATSTEPQQAEREEKRFHGVWWGFSYDEALEKAKAENKPVLIDFTGVNCSNCRLMEASVLSRPEVAEVLGRFVTVQLYTLPNVPIKSLTSDQRETLAEKNTDRQLDLTNESSNPLYVVLSPDGKLVTAQGGYIEPPAFLNFLKGALGKVPGTTKVAQTEGSR